MKIIFFGFLIAYTVCGICNAYYQEHRYVDFNVPINGASASVDDTKRITGGIQMNSNDQLKFNYQAGMYITKLDGAVTICGGAIIHPEIIMTAAHCVYKSSYVSIFTGTHIKPMSEFSLGLIRVYFENITIHKDYNDWTLEDDVALIRLPKPLTLSVNVGVIQLASYSWTTCESGTALVSGWGKTGESDYSIPTIMNYLQVDPITYDQCHSVYNFLNKGKQLCSSGDLFQGICPGDSGGPYAFENEYGYRYLCGINSFIATLGCVNNWPKGYSSVAYYNDNGWICKNSNGLVGCSSHNYKDL